MGLNNISVYIVYMVNRVRDTTVISSRVPNEIAEKIDEAVWLGYHLTASNFVKKSVETELKRLFPEETADEAKLRISEEK